MRPEIALADRREAVRQAAAGWRAAGAIDAATLAQVDAAYPDDRVRAGTAMRVLLGFFTILAGFAALGLLAVAADNGEIGIALVVGAAAVAATELLLTFGRRRRGGVEEGTAILALVMLPLGSLAFVSGPWNHEATSLRTVLAVLTAAAAAAVLRWGMPAAAAVGAAALALLLVQTGFGVALWTLFPLAAALPLLRGARSARLAPAHREACLWALAVALAALYLAVNLAAADDRWIADLELGYARWAAAAALPAWLRFVHGAGTALLPPLVLAAGVRLRERLLLWAGLLMAAASLVTLRYYVHLAPLWLELILGGGAAIAAALLLRRRLDAGAAHERAGFTAEPLFGAGDRARVVEVAAAVVAFTPTAQAAESKPAFEGGGGEFGGGGASDSF